MTPAVDDGWIWEGEAIKSQKVWRERSREPWSRQAESGLNWGWNFGFYLFSLSSVEGLYSPLHTECKAKLKKRLFLIFLKMKSCRDQWFSHMLNVKSESWNEQVQLWDAAFWITVHFFDSINNLDLVTRLWDAVKRTKWNAHILRYCVVQSLFYKPCIHLTTSGLPLRWCKHTEASDLWTYTHIWSIHTHCLSP